MSSLISDINETDIRRYVAMMFAPDDVVEIRALGVGRPERNWFTARDIDGIVRFARAMNIDESRDVYIGANPRPAAGASGNDSIVTFRGVFADLDGPSHGKSCNLSASDPDEQVREVTDRLRAKSLPDPSIIIHSGGGVHVYWRLYEAETDAGRWSMTMRDLVHAIGADAACTNAERIMRLPGTWNRKRGAMCRIVTAADQSATSIDVMRESLGCDDGRDVAPPSNVCGNVAPSVPLATPRRQKPSDDESVIDEFNRRHSIRDILRHEGYHVGRDTFTRPGKDPAQGHSGTLRVRESDGVEVSVHFSSRDPLHTSTGGYTSHDPFSAFAHIYQGGDIGRAVRDAAERMGMSGTRKGMTDREVLESILNGPDVEEYVDLAYIGDYSRAGGDVGAALRRVIEILGGVTEYDRQIERLASCTEPAKLIRANRAK